MNKRTENKINKRKKKENTKFGLFCLCAYNKRTGYKDLVSTEEKKIGKQSGTLFKDNS